MHHRRSATEDFCGQAGEKGDDGERGATVDGGPDSTERLGGIRLTLQQIRIRLVEATAGTAPNIPTPFVSCSSSPR